MGKIRSKKKKKNKTLENHPLLPLLSKILLSYFLDGKPTNQASLTTNRNYIAQTIYEYIHLHTNRNKARAQKRQRERIYDYRVGRYRHYKQNCLLLLL